MLFLLMIFVGVLVWIGDSESDFFAEPNRIGVIEIRGVIDDVRETVEAIRKYRKDTNIKAILLRIDTPGGGVGASQELYREVRRTIEEKPVVASLGGIAASGGYYIASAATRIFSNPGTVTGSIGVIVHFPNLQGLFDKIGYNSVTIKSGQFKDIGNPNREMTPEEKQLMQSTIDEAYRQFVQDVARGRNLPEEKVREVADGRIFMGKTAHEWGLVDELGNFQDAVDGAAKLGKIEGEPELIHFKKKKRSLLDFLLGSDVSEKVSAFLDGTGSFLRYQLPVFP
jgi:protease-4